MNDTATHPLPQLAPNSMRHRVLVALRSAIINGQFKPGERLTEEQICAQMAVSRGPVREAMRELELEGLIASTPYKGAEVLDISDREVTDLLMPIRLVLEEYGFRSAVEKRTPESLAQLEAIVDRMAQAAKKSDVDAVIQADTDFHEAILRDSGQVHCLQIWRTLLPRVRAYFARWRYKSPDLDAQVAEHRQLLEDFRSGDIERIRARLHKHIIVKPNKEQESAGAELRNRSSTAPSRGRPAGGAPRRSRSTAAKSVRR